MKIIRVLNYLLGLLIIVMSIIFYNNYTERNSCKERYINQLYFQVDNCINSLEKLNENYDKEEIQIFSKDILRLKNILYDGHCFLDKSINPYYMTIFDDFEEFIYEGIKDSDLPIHNGFLKDGEIDQKEEDFLMNLEDDLNDILCQLYSEDTGQENHNLSIKEINNILEPFFDKYSKYDMQLQK